MANTGCDGFVLGPERVEENIILITGTGRAGKTLLSKVLASHSNVQWIEEPFELYNPTIMCGLGLLSEELFRMMFTSCLHELIVNNILLRNGNFRPNDLSSVWNFKSGSDIFGRLEGLSSRSDVEDYIERGKPYFIIDIPEILPFTGYIRDLCSNISVINVVRDPYTVADDCFRKGWYSADDRQISENNLFRMYNGRRLPWWVRKGEEEAFINAPIYEKGLMYWLSIQAWEKDLTLNGNKYDICVKYEDIVKDIDGVLDKINDTLDIHPTTITNAVKSEIKSDFVTDADDIKRSDDHIDKTQLHASMKTFGYI